MKRLIYAIFFALCLLGTSAHAQQSVYFVWDAPTTNTDGSAIVEGDLGWYRVYVVNKSETIDPATMIAAVEIESAAFGVQNPPPRILLTKVPGLTPGKKVAVTAVNTWGFESDPSNDLTGNKPGNPTNVRTEKQ